ncbi:MAG: hypothetical protein V3V15_01275 [Sphingorhabdus sp.]
MSVVIDEVVHEHPADQTVAAAQSTPNGQDRAGVSEMPDIDRLGFEYSRRQHRLNRLWAD